MIQRIQSLWLLLAAICGGLSFQFPFYSGTRMMGEPPQPTPNVEMTATFNIPIIIFMTIAIVGAVHAIFSYYKRKHQFVVTLISMISSIIALVLLFLATSEFEGGGVRIESLLYFVVPVFLFLAARGVRKDDKLVRSMDRLR
jgi:ribose/xylose/arabinose/galactoside ABC-type transport system permease subunit